MTNNNIIGNDKTHSIKEEEKEIVGGFFAGLSRSLARALGQLGRSGLVKGGVSGMFEETASYPLDLVKSKMQTSTSSSTSIYSIFKDIYKSEGAIGLFKGLSSPLIASALISSTQFGTFEATFELLKKKSFTQSNQINLLCAGATSGFVQSFIATPVDVIKIRMQLQGDAHGGSNIQTAKSVLKEAGFKGLYRGFGATLYRDVPGLAIFFTSYETLKSHFGIQGGHGGNADQHSNHKTTSDFIKILASGGLAGCLYHSSTHPFDVVKTLMQADIKKEKYNGTFDCMKKVYSQYGYKGLFKGFQPTVLKSFLSNAVGFWVYELIQDL